MNPDKDGVGHNSSALHRKHTFHTPKLEVKGQPVYLESVRGGAVVTPCFGKEGSRL